MLNACCTPQATASHHLGILRRAGLVTGERRGTWIYYRAVTGRLRSLGEALTAEL